MVNFQRKQRYGWEDLLTIMHLLRAPEGCPWDREQTHQSIRRNFLEETYEALDAIDRNDIPGMCEELGDVLLQVVFHSVMEEEQGRFTADDVVDGVAQKLVFRHTHVFGAAEAADSAQALEGWEAQKKKEKGFTSPADAVEAVPHTLPALWRAEKIVSRSVKAGFNWDSIAGALDSKKGLDIKVLETGALTTLADYFVICTATSTTQIKALADICEKTLKNAGEPPHHVEGHRGGTWVLLDYGCVAIHVFNEEARAFYGLERLWSDGHALDLTGVLTPDAAK